MRPPRHHAGNLRNAFCRFRADDQRDYRRGNTFRTLAAVQYFLVKLFNTVSECLYGKPFHRLYGCFGKLRGKCFVCQHAVKQSRQVCSVLEQQSSFAICNDVFNTFVLFGYDRPPAIASAKVSPCVSETDALQNTLPSW